MVLVATDDPESPCCNASARIWRYGWDEGLRRLVPRLSAEAGLEAFTGSVRREGGLFHDRFVAARPDAIIAMVFGQRIPEHLLDLVGRRAWNVHPVVPGRPLAATGGPEPFEAAYRLGARSVQLCIHQMTGAFDDGEEVARSDPFPLPPATRPGAELMLELQRRTAPLAAALVRSVLPGRFDHWREGPTALAGIPRGKELTMNDRTLSQHRTHQRAVGHPRASWPRATGDERCLAFAVGRRYLEIEDHEGLQFRVGVSFGHNPFTPEMATGFVPPPVLPGRFVFGLHLIANKGHQLTIYDEWMDAREAGVCEDPEQALVLARSIVEAMPDEEYFGYVRESRDDKGPLKTSDLHLLEDFEVVQGEAF